MWKPSFNGDNVSSHVSQHVIEKCEELNIHFILLTPQTLLTSCNRLMQASLLRWKKTIEKVVNDPPSRRTPVNFASLHSVHRYSKDWQSYDFKSATKSVIKATKPFEISAVKIVEIKGSCARVEDTIFLRILLSTPFLRKEKTGIFFHQLFCLPLRPSGLM